MYFFKSVFSEDSDPPSPGSRPDHEPPTPSSSSAGDETSQGTTSAWSFGGLIKTLATRSESVVETYRRDLQEFGSGLKNETVTLREVASRAVKDLPSSIEISASKAQVAFSSIAEIIAQGKETLLAPDIDSDSSDRVCGGGNLSRAQSVGSGRYSRFDAQLRAIQCDVNTYVEEPEDAADYNNWKLGFDLGGRGEEIENLVRDNETIGSIYNRVVPTNVDSEGFWSRYFYRVQKLQQTESVRANLVKRAISREDEEELSWDVDDDEEEEEEQANPSLNGIDVPLEVDSLVTANPIGEAIDQKGEVSHSVENEKSVDVVEPRKEEVLDKEMSSEGSFEAKVDESSRESDENSTPVAIAESGKDNVISVVSNGSSTEVEDLGWDEIEDLGSDDDKNASRGGSDRAELRRRLNAADEEEELSWDIEDVDEPIES